ncbi:unnamed product, partial [Ostreococcus tauri]
ATCVDVSAPLGTSYVRDIETFERERREIGRRTTYPVRFARNARGDVVFDRAFNVDALATSRGGGRDVVREIEWDIDDPNVLKLTTSDGTRVFYKITARSSARDDDARTMTTSELAEIVLDRNRSGSPSVKSTRVVTKYKWRDVDDAREGPAIVASQTVYEYLSPVGDAGTASRDDADAAFIRARGRAVSQSVHRIAMIRYPDR